MSKLSDSSLTFIWTVETLVDIIVNAQLVDERIVFFVDSAELAERAENVNDICFVWLVRQILE